jgi:hypothetical protein
MVCYDGDDAWVLDMFRRTVETIGGSLIPGPGEDCEWCRYVELAGAAGA